MLTEGMRDVMFRYEYPEFKNKQLLKADMLELLRDYSRQSAQLLFQGYGNGIMNGCELSWSDGWLTVNSGVIYRNGNLYFMDKPYRLECQAENQQRYLAVKFQQEKKQMNKISGETRIYLRREPVRTQDEMELCRFRLQEGSRLRSVYKDFQDHSTEYDTINIIHAPFAGASGTTMNPEILLQYAEEMMETEMTDAFDIAFCMNVLAAYGKVSKKSIVQYLKSKGKGDIESEENGDLYQGLLRILANRKSHSNRGQVQEQIGKRIMLV